MMRTTVITRPSPIVTLAEAKTWLRVDHTADDDLIQNIIIPSAQGKIEMETGLSLSPGMEVTVDFYDVEKTTTFDLPFAPVTEIDGVAAVADTVVIGAGDTTVDYTCGFDVCPPDLKLAVLNQITWDYDNRGSSEIAPNSKGTILLHTRNLMF